MTTPTFQILAPRHEPGAIWSSRRRARVAALVFGFNLGCAALGQGIDWKQHLPYSAGDTSTFSSEGAFNLSLTATSDTEFNWYAFGPSEGLRRRFRSNASGLALLSEEGVAVNGTVVSVETHTAPWIVAPLALAPGETFRSSTTYSGSESDATWAGTANGTFSVAAAEAVVTPAGTFNAIKLTFSDVWAETGTGFTANGTTTEIWWVAPNVGLIKLDYSFQENRTEEGVTETDAGQLVFVLETSTRLALPTILLQPTARTISVGETVQFSVTATGPGVLLYQWYRDGALAIPGATQSSFSITNAGLADAGSYSVEVRNGNGRVLSSNALLTVNAAPAIVNIADPCIKDRILRRFGRLTGEVTLAEMRSLTNLAAERCFVTNLTGLEFAVNLAALTLSDNKITDLTPLSGLTNLTILRLDKNSISDLGPLANLTNLNELVISGNAIADIAPLAGLKELTRLIAENNRIADLGPLAGLSKLVNVFFAGNGFISDLEPLRNIVRIQQLSLGGNSIRDVGALQGLVNLRSLSLRANAISDISPLRDLRFITTLELDSNRIEDLTPLASYTRLTVLATVQGNRLDVTPGSPDRLVIDGWIARGTRVVFMPQELSPPVLIVFREGPTLRLRWASETGVFYRVQSSSNLVDWINASPTPRLGTGNPLTQDFPVSRQPAQFFRLAIRSQ